MLTSCTRDEQQSNISQNRKDSTFIYFQKSLSNISRETKIRYLKKAVEKSTDDSDSLLLNIYDHLVYYQTLNKSYDSAFYYSEKLKAKSEEKGDSINLAKAYYRKARIFLYLDKPDAVLQNMYKAKQLVLTIGDSTSAGRYLVEIANAQYRLGDFSGAQSNATEALKILSKNDSVYLKTAHNVIALSNNNLGDYDEAIQEYKNALSYSENREFQYLINNNIAMVLAAQGKFDESNTILKNLLAKADYPTELRLRLKDNYYFNNWQLKKGPVADTLITILEKQEKLKDLEGQISTYKHLTTILKRENEQKAKIYASRYLKKSKLFGDIPSQLQALKILVELSTDAESKKYAKNYFHINDSVQNARNHIKNIYAKIQYDEEEKIRQINELERLSAVRQLQILEQRNQKIIFLTLAIIICVLGLFLIYYFQQQHRKREIRKVYETEIRMAKIIHDELANEIYQAMIAIPDSDSSILNKLELIYQRTRNISRTHNEIDTNKNFVLELDDMIRHNSQKVPLVTRGIKEINWFKLRKEQKIIIYRVIQELMVNMQKHSQAEQVALIFKNQHSALEINYTDNGIGADLNQRRFSGLQNVENRIHSIKGKVTFQSEKFKGFKCSIIIPV